MQLTTDEKSSGKLSETTLEHSVEILRREGFVILEAAMPQPWIKNMRHLFTSELQASYDQNSTALETTKMHGGFQSPLAMSFLDPTIIENGIAFQILERMLGEHFFGCLPYGCNTAFPGSKKQNVHRDCGHLFPEVANALPPMLLVVNFLLDEFTIENGATEIWPGSHLRVDANTTETKTLKISPSLWSEHTSTRTVAPAGSIVIRDMRTWHRGMENTTSQLRTMLSIVYYRQYSMPDNLKSADEIINDGDWHLISDRAKWTYRLRR